MAAPSNAPSVRSAAAVQAGLGGNCAAVIFAEHDADACNGPWAMEAGSSVVVEFLDTQVGTWQCSVDAGATWRAVRTDLVNREGGMGLVLGPDACLRVLPCGGTKSLARVVFHRLGHRAGQANGSYRAYAAEGEDDRLPSITLLLELAAINGAPPPTRARLPRNKMVRVRSARTTGAPGSGAEGTGPVRT